MTLDSDSQFLNLRSHQNHLGSLSKVQTPRPWPTGTEVLEWEVIHVYLPESELKKDNEKFLSVVKKQYTGIYKKIHSPPPVVLPTGNRF